MVRGSGTMPRENRTETRQEEPKVAGEAREPGGRQELIEVLARAADDDEFRSRLADNAAEALDEYYTLTPDEKAALASGDLKKIESWVGRLDQRLATWLWSRLSQEKW